MRLSVRNFSCLESIDIEFKDYTVFIGEQASGKSLTSKLYFFFREMLSKQLLSYAMEDKTWNEFRTSLPGLFCEIFPEYSWKRSNFYISLANHDDNNAIHIKHSARSTALHFEFSSELKAKYPKLKQLHQTLQGAIKNLQEQDAGDFFVDFERVRASHFMKLAYNLSFSATLLERVTYIPAGRSFFSAIRDNVFGMWSENIELDPFLKEFGKFYETSKHGLKAIGRSTVAPPVPPLTPEEEQDRHLQLQRFDEISSSILKGYYIFGEKEDWLMCGQAPIRLSNASSGQQESLPAILGLRALALRRSSPGIQSVVIEEPEAHLFPSSQKAMIELLFLASTMGAKPKLILTTHSPYVLTCVNNEILKLKEKPGENISAYYLTDGKAYDIVDKDSGLIDGSALDRISAELAEEFYAALESAR
jgi:hypothetical protein